MIWLSDYLKSKYGFSLKKISIDAGFTCPNRDGKIGYGGCIFCSQKGSGDFTKGPGFSVEEQINLTKDRMLSKTENLEQNTRCRYIAYFQAYTNTYGDVDKMRQMYLAVANREDIAIISIATRPDCLDDEVLLMLDEISAVKPVWVELGLQTIHERTADYIRRGYKLSVYDEAVRRLVNTGVEQIITHVILGLPGESSEMMLDTVKHVCNMKKPDIKTCFGIKLQLLHVLEGTDLAEDYRAGMFECMSFDEYMDTVSKCINILPDNMIVHRITGDGDKNTLIAPKWSVDKKKVINAIKQRVQNVEEISIKKDIIKTGNGFEYSFYENISEAASEKPLPVFIYGTMGSIPGNPEKLFSEVKERTSEDFIIVSYNVRNWNSDFSPWEAGDLAGNGCFEGKGLETLSFLTDSLIPAIKERYSNIGRECKIFPSGYSLAGLFSLWAYYENPSLFNGVISCSGSLWFPGYKEYMEQKAGDNAEADGNDIVYLSLGGRESASGNAAMDCVADITKQQYELIKKDSNILKCRYDINKGGHFADSAKRMAKGITWCMSVM